MQHRRTTLSLTALCTAATLLLTACGGGGDDDGKSDKIDGAKDSASGSPSPSASETAGDKVSPTDFRTSDIELPDDVKLVFDWKQPSDKEKAGALVGAADFMRVVRRGMAEHDAKDPMISRHTVPLQSAQDYVSFMRKQTSSRDYSIAGTERLSKEQVGDMVDGKLTEVSFCSDQSKIFSKEIKTGKVLRNPSTDKSYLRFSLVMQKPSEAGDPWKARTVDVTERAVKQCKE